MKKARKMKEARKKPEVPAAKIVNHEEGKVRLIPKELLVVPSYQRRLRTKFVDKESKAIDMRKLGVLCVRPLPDGKYEVFSGQHRLELARRCTEITKLKCLVYENISRKDAIKIFIEVNSDINRMTPLDKFHAKLERGNPDSVTVNRILFENGYRASFKNTAGCMRCISSAEIWFKKWKDLGKPEVFGDLFTLVAKLHNGNPIQDRVLVGVMAAEHLRLTQGSGPSLLHKTSCDKLLISGLHSVLSSINSQYGSTGKSWSSEKARAFGVINIINKGRRVNQIKLGLEI